MKAILVATDKQKIADAIQGCLHKEFTVDISRNRNDGLQKFKHKRYEFTFLDVEFLWNDTSLNGPVKYKEALQPYWKAFPSAHIIVLSSKEQLREAVSAIRAGASDYLTYPIDPIEVRFVMESVSQYQKIESELLYLRENIFRSGVTEGASTNSRIMREILDKSCSVAQTRTTVLLTGETGTGKGVLARLIHSYSNRADKPFIAVHCGAIPDTLVESELFGHEKGAFTGAVQRKLGKFQIADTGTIFLDEISTVSPAVQIKLLQVLQDKTFSRVGGDTSIQVDVRIIAATNADLKQLCNEGDFRKDLYYRLNVFPIEIPPLRERPEDIPILVDIFVERLNRNYNKKIKGVESEVIEALQKYSWPGNIRELENIIERAYIVEKNSLLTPAGFPSELFTFECLNLQNTAAPAPTLAEIRSRAVEQAEIRYLREILSLNKGRIDHSASMAGVSARQLHNLMAKYGIRKQEFK